MNAEDVPPSASLSVCMNLSRSRHQADAEQREDYIQTDEHRSPDECPGVVCEFNIHAHEKHT